MNESSIVDKLQELFDLYKSGALSKDEYETVKSDILNLKDLQEPAKEYSSYTLSDQDYGKTNKKTIQITSERESAKEKRKKINIKHFLFSILFTSVFLLVIMFLFFKSELNFFAETVIQDELIETVKVKTFWSESEATELIMNELSEGSEELIINELHKLTDWSLIWDPEEVSSEWFHEVVDFVNVKFYDTELYVGIIFSNFKDNDFSNSYGLLSIFEFQDNGSWDIHRRSLAFAAGSSGGRVPDLKIINIAADNYGLRIVNSSGRMGWISQYNSLYAFVDNEFKNVLGIGHEYTIDDDYSCNFTFIYGESGFSDLKVTQRETLSDGHQTITENEYYFDGAHYIERKSN